MFVDSILTQQAVQQGIWAILFVSLYLYQLRENSKTRDEARVRESQLTSFIADMGKQFESLTKMYEKLTDDVDEIKQDIRLNTIQQSIKK